jgi:hypothetical protein
MFIYTIPLHQNHHPIANSLLDMWHRLMQSLFNNYYNRYSKLFKQCNLFLLNQHHKNTLSELEALSFGNNLNLQCIYQTHKSFKFNQLMDMTKIPSLYLLCILQNLCKWRYFHRCWLTTFNHSHYICRHSILNQYPLVMNRECFKSKRSPMSRLHAFASSKGNHCYHRNMLVSLKELS